MDFGLKSLELKGDLGNGVECKGWRDAVVEERCPLAQRWWCARTGRRERRGCGRHLRNRWEGSQGGKSPVLEKMEQELPHCGG